MLQSNEYNKTYITWYSKVWFEDFGAADRAKNPGTGRIPGATSVRKTELKAGAKLDDDCIRT
jgi:hypothetical protein